MRKLSPGEIKTLKENDIDPHDLRTATQTVDLYRGKRGNVWIGNKDGTGAPESTGINISNLRHRQYVKKFELTCQTYMISAPRELALTLQT
jgi:Bacterial toxin 33